MGTLNGVHTFQWLLHKTCVRDARKWRMKHKPVLPHGSGSPSVPTPLHARPSAASSHRPRLWSLLLLCIILATPE